ncbi:M56 family metallopeptidase [Allofournierella sp. CML151]|uniref:M56 family metallopeptidase n=1 Tax=Allofournierella sp. CML151 TaxID=2998082 RepID=UPI0022EB7E1A|nr:M56 family metallopeptidase [Fournierella sp. CML151]
MELLITSSLLILAVLAARALLAGRISRRMQYALWGLVLLRLLLPVSLPQSRASVLNALPDTAQVSLMASAQPERGEALPAPVDTVMQNETDTAPETDLAQPATGGTQASLSGGDSDAAASAPQHPEWSLNPAALLPVVWAAGALLTGGAMLWANLRFSLQLRRERCLLDLDPERTGGLPVYLCHDLASPCLHGLLHPAIYLNPAALESPDRLEFVLAHEKVHHRHKDHLWGALRCFVLAAYWFDPLVWWAAAASKRDCELACDEAVTASMEEDRRRDYGRCLVELIPRRAPGTALLAATSMSGTAHSMQQRLKAIVTAKKPRRAAIALTLAGVVLLTACTFTGAREKTIASADELIGEGETVRRRVSWQQESGTQEIILVQASAAPEGESLRDGQGWFKLYYWNSNRDNTAENTLHYEGRLSNRQPIQVIAQFADGSMGDYARPTADDTVQLLEVHLYQSNGESVWYDWRSGELSAQPEEPPEYNTPESATASIQDDVLQQLVGSLQSAEGGIRFTIPAVAGWTGEDWHLTLWRLDGGEGEPLTQGLPEVFTSQDWQPGQSYLVPADCLTDGPVTLIARLSNEPGQDVLTGNMAIAVHDVFSMATGIYGDQTAHQSIRTRTDAELIAEYPASEREQTGRQQALEQLWASCIWQEQNFTFTIPADLSPNEVELRFGWANGSTFMFSEISWGERGIRLKLNRSSADITMVSDEQGLFTGQTWQPGDTITVNGAGRGNVQPVLLLRDKTTREEQKIWLPASAQPLPTVIPAPGDPGSAAPQADYEFYNVEPAQTEEFQQRLDTLVENLQYSQGGSLTVTIPETAEVGEWELRLLRYNESRGSWTIVSAGLPDAFVSQGWQPGQQATVDAETMSGSDWKMEAKNTVLGGWVQFRLGLSGTPLAPTPTPIRPEADQQARADEAEQQYENWVASQSTLSPTPTPMPIETLGGKGYPAGRVRAQGSLELDGRTQELVALQIQPPEGVSLAGGEVYLNLYYRDSQAPNPEFGLAFTGKVSQYQTFTIDYRDATGQLVTHSNPENAASMELELCLGSEPKGSTSGKWRRYTVDEIGITVSAA